MIGGSNQRCRTEDLNRAIDSLWQQEFNVRAGVLAPLYIEPVKRGSLLFVGMNPSFNERWIERKFKDEIGGSASSFFRWRNVRHSDDRKKEIRRIDKLSLTKHPYFFRPREIAREAGCEMAHLDLFLCRQTNQTVVGRWVCDRKSGELNTFGAEQLKIFKRAIKRYRPSAVIVINAAARDQLASIYPEPPFDPESGHRWMEVGGGDSVPLFYSGMLSGKRALDCGSYERLKWHVCRVIRKRENRELGD